tara:strand:- start:6 stop:1103 length:1098 start_codon:yes stop_codon:yes gene_type:complete
MTNLHSSISAIEMAIAGKHNPQNPIHVSRQGESKLLLGERDLAKVYNSKSDDGFKVKNALGADIDITTFTEILQGVVEQKNYEIDIAKFVTVKPGQGAWQDELVKWKSFNLTDNDLSKGDLNLGNGKIQSVNVGVEAVKIPTQRWADQAEYNIFEIKTASETRQWDLVTSLETAKRKTFDLGLQKLTFLGHANRVDIEGLLNQTGVTADTNLITKPISTMTAAELNTFAGSVLGTYFTNSNSTERPNTLVMPTTDFLGLANAPSADFPIGKSRGQYLKDAFAEIIPGFQIIDSAFCSQVNNNLSKNRYVLYNNAEDNLFMPLPIPYTTALQGTSDNFNFTSISYAQYAGIALMRPASMLYMDYAD